MDTQQIVEQAKARFNFAETKRYLKEKYLNQLVLAHAGGSWNISSSFLATLTALDGDVILVDAYDNPIKVNTKELLAVASEKYNLIMSQWLAEYADLIRKR
jgi:hypothetical protein